MRRPGPALPALFLAAAAATGFAADSATRREALETAYPGAEIRAERVFLSAAEKDAAQRLSGEEISSSLVARYVARREGRVIGRAYVDTHVVRTKKESLLICLDAEGAVRRIEVTAFLEPPEYLASAPWYAQFAGRKLNDDLRMSRGIRPIAGATLTAQAATDAVRRALAIDRALRERGGS